MRSGEFAVRIDHLGLNPQSELHTEGGHMVDEGMKPVGPHALVDEPVAEPGSIVSSTGEPTVVEDETFDADIRRGVRECRQLLECVIEIHRFPGVERDRAGPVRMLGALAQLTMEAVR
ncbi:hypothetical protein GCM10009778_09360 [Microbacterium terricola]